MPADHHAVFDRVGGGRHQSLFDEVDHIRDRAHGARALSLGQIDEQIAHHPPELTQGMGRGGVADQFAQEIREERMQDCQQRVAAALGGDDRLAVLGEGLTVEVGIHPAGGMPEHAFHAVLGVLEVDPVVVEMAPDLRGAEVPVEVLEDREWIEELMFPLVDQVLAVGVQDFAIALEHIDDLDQMIGGIAEEGFTAKQLGDDLLGVEAGVAVNQLGRNNRHLSSLPSIAGPRR